MTEAKPKASGKSRQGKNQPKGCWIRPAARLAIYLRDGFRCIYCLSDLHGVDPRDITLDHLTPKSDGGSNDPSNLTTACRSCNCRRQDTPLERFAGPETIAHIRRNCSRDLAPYREMAKAILAGEMDTDSDLEG
jgi:5-methylcytosine-specific restriction endonuclease McrA